jgi:hypothetical protein
LFTEKDKIIYESSLATSNDLQFVFCLCKKKDAKTMQKNYSDIKFFTHPEDSNFINNSSLVLSAEDSEIVDQIFMNRVNKIKIKLH